MLDIYTKITLMLEELRIIRDMLNDDSVRPQTRCNLEDKAEILRKDLKGMYCDLFKIISN